jgi:hypothetical protein
MPYFAASIGIRARPEAIWALLTDAARFPLWNSTVEKVEGRIALRETIRVYAKAAGGRAFALKVSEFVPPARMVWSSGMPLGLFTGTRLFTVTAQPSGETQFAMREEFTGLLAPLITKSIPDLQPSFETFAADLKRRAESSAQ